MGLHDRFMPLEASFLSGDPASDLEASPLHEDGACEICGVFHAVRPDLGPALCVAIANALSRAKKVRSEQGECDSS